MSADPLPNRSDPSPAPRVLVCGRLSGDGLDILRDAGCHVDHDPERGGGSLQDVIAPYAGVIVHTAQIVDAATIEAAPIPPLGPESRC